MDSSATYTVISDADVDIYDAAFDVGEKVTKVTANMLGSGRLGLAGSIAYLDEGADLYERFKDTHINDNPANRQSDSAQLISIHKAALRSQAKDIERLIIVGGGSYESVSSQELALIQNHFTDSRRNTLSEIVLIDVSLEFLRQDIQAIKDLQAQHKKDVKIIPIRADVKDITGEKFDEILQAYGSAGREKKKALVIETGATFGNIEGVSSTDRLPGNEIDVQMAHLSELVGMGSVVMFDHFTQGNQPSYYNTSELSTFFNNIPNIMNRYARGLEDFHGNTTEEQFFEYRARSLHEARMTAHELVALRPQSPRLVNGVERVFPIEVGDRLSMMFSLTARADDVKSRPHENTGLESVFYVSHKNLVMHVFEKVGLPGALYQTDSSSHSLDTRSTSPANTALTRSSSNSKVQPTFRPLDLGASPAM